MAIWLAGLATRDSAKRASRWGGVVAPAFFQAACLTIGNFAFLSVADKPLGNATAWFIGASLIPMLFLVGGIRLRQAKGWIAESLAALALILDSALFGPASTPIQSGTAFLIRAVLLILIVNGVRGTLALRIIGDKELDDVYRKLSHSNVRYWWIAVICSYSASRSRIAIRSGLRSVRCVGLNSARTSFASVTRRRRSSTVICRSSLIMRSSSRCLLCAPRTPHTGGSRPARRAPSLC